MFFKVVPMVKVGEEEKRNENFSFYKEREKQRIIPPKISSMHLSLRHGETANKCQDEVGKLEWAQVASNHKT